MTTIYFYLFLIQPLIILAHFSVQDVYWRDYVPGNVPHDAFIATPKDRYVAQVSYQGYNPGIFYPDTQVAAIDWSGKQIIKNNFKILCATDVSRLYWDKVDFSKAHENQMKNAVRGGWQPSYDLFIGRLFDAGEWRIGRVLSIETGNVNGLYVWDAAGKSKRVLQFEILKYNTTIVSS
ncbi:hypothetical protein AMK59_5067, partial [Oryctes borbonicus]